MGLATLSAAAPSSAAAQTLDFSPCAQIQSFSCATLAVPLDRQSGLTGTISLHLARKLAGAAPSKTAVIGLAGGPGQAALPLASAMAGLIAPALKTRDMIVFDQRGTGESGPLRCQAQPHESVGEYVKRCAQQIGAARSGYSTAESVQDIEAIREAGGYEKLVLYGTSYGTKVALDYAETYPSHVEALVLDSVVPPAGSEPFERQTFQAIRRVLAEICAHHACRGIASKPLTEMAHLARRLAGKPLYGRLYDGSGKPHKEAVTDDDLLGVLIAGDLNPALRAMLPASVAAALHGDAAPLLRLTALAVGRVPEPPKGHPPLAHQDVDEGLFLDTSCEDASYPWQRASSPTKRLSEAFAAIVALPPSAFYPFDALTAAGASTLVDCAYWPYSSTAAAAPGPLPDVPTLILSGAQDLRTPTAGARSVAATIPDAQLLVVPYTGHSVLGSELGDCAADAVGAFFAGATVQPCKPGSEPFKPTPAIPASLAMLSAPHGLAGRPGRTLQATLDTLVDLDDELRGAILQIREQLPAGTRFGGLHGGYAKLLAGALRLHRVSLVPGVQVSGVLRLDKDSLRSATLSIGGAAAAHGALQVDPGGRATGTLGGRPFALTTAQLADLR
ncbi:MAG TPA: alpha/beta fold hydrolase [Solirubrobacteraceae bacterium]